MYVQEVIYLQQLMIARSQDAALTFDILQLMMSVVAKTNETPRPGRAKVVPRIYFCSPYPEFWQLTSSYFELMEIFSFY